MRAKFLWFNLVVLIALFMLRGRLLGLAPQTPLPIYGQLEAFQLTDQRGQAVGLNTLRGSSWVMNFMFTRCPSQCPSMSFKMSALQQTLPAHVRFVSVSVDPEHDTPEILSEYAKRFKADETRWIFLTGKQTDVERLLKMTHLGASGEPSMHSLRFILIDKHGSVRGYYNSEEETPIQNLQRDVRRL